MAVAVLVDDRELTIGLDGFKANASDRDNLLRIAGELMRGSIARTFREQGSPAGSWAKLALSTLKKKGYGAGHKLLILSGRLFGSITYTVSNGVLTIGTNLVYAAVQQYGSADRRGAAIGPQAKLADRAVKVDTFDYMRVMPFKQHGRREITDIRGHRRTVSARLQGPSNARSLHVGAHQRHQNIPPRPYLVFRPEDPARIASAFERYLGGKAVALGRVGAR